jgi:DNA-binding beta-propeller fold protein YncE
MKTIITSVKGPPLRRVLCSLLFGAAAFCVVATKNIQAAIQAPADIVWVTTAYTIAKYYANGTAINTNFITEPSVIQEPYTYIPSEHRVIIGSFPGYLGGILVSGPILYVGTAEGVTYSYLYLLLYHPIPVDYVIATYNAKTGNVINLGFFAYYSRFPVAAPQGMALSGTNLYVANNGENSISKINTTVGGNNQNTSSISSTVTKDPYALAVNANLHCLYVTNNYQNSNGDFYISTYSTENGALIKANFIQIRTGGLYGLALQGNTLYVSVFSGTAPGVYTYKADTGQLLKGPFVRVNEPVGIAIGSPPLNGQHPTLYVASHQDAMIYEFDAITGARLSYSIKVNAPGNITVEPATQQ